MQLQPEKEVVYQAGQYISILVSPQGDRRSYSVATFPGESGLGITVDTSPMGIGSKFLLSQKAGDTISILAPLGSFTVPDSQMTKPQLFVATGSGIVPFRSIICDLLKNKHFTLPIRLVWGMRHEEEVIWRDEFESMAANYANFQFDLIVSRPTDAWKGFKGHVDEVLSRTKWEGWNAYICGNQKMIEEICVLLKARGVKPEDLHFEKFF